MPFTTPFPNPPLQAGILNNASQCVISGNFYNHGPHKCNHKSGITALYRASVPEAAYDSSARKYAPKCFPDTREQHIQDFTLWASNNMGQQQRRFRMSWMEGPFGVGKSTIAQTCAGKIRTDLLGATFFFSRPNQIDDPDRFFHSIAYQISTKVKPFADLLDEKICNDPSLLTKTMEVQFHELIVRPFLELKESGVSVQERVVIIDGLDECRDDRAQCEIIELIAMAVQEHGEDLPVLWAFFSRPEPHIVQTFSSETISPLVWTMSLPVSQDVDKEIELYIRGQFKNIQKRIYYVGFDGTWPSESQISALVRKSAGLYVHASTTMKYIGDPEALDPKDRLKEVLSLSPYFPKPTAVGGPSPTAEIDVLYTLIMRRIPPHILPITQQMLLLINDMMFQRRRFAFAATVLGLSISSAMTALSKLRSVLTINERLFDVTFHHASFMEFLRDVNRSGTEFCITQPQHYACLLKRTLVFLESSPPESSESCGLLYSINAYRWCLFASIDEELALLFTRFDFARNVLDFNQVNQIKELYDKFPPEYRNRVIQQYQPCPSLQKYPDDLLSREIAVIYVLGQGEKSVRYNYDVYEKFLGLRFRD